MEMWPATNKHVTICPSMLTSYKITFSIRNMREFPFLETFVNQPCIHVDEFIVYIKCIPSLATIIFGLRKTYCPMVDALMRWITEAQSHWLEVTKWCVVAKVEHLNGILSLTTCHHKGWTLLSPWHISNF